MWGRLALGMIALGIALGVEARTAPLPDSQEADVIDAVYRVDGVGRSQVVFKLPPGPRTITSIEWQPADGTSEHVWRSARLRIVWDGVEPESAGVDLPLGRFLDLEQPRAAEADPEPPGRDEAARSNPPALRNDAPMPYRSQGRLILDSNGRLRGTFRIRSEAGAGDRKGLGYYRAALEPDPEAAGDGRSVNETPPLRVWYDSEPGPRFKNENEDEDADATGVPANPC